MLCWKELKIKENPLGKESNPKLYFIWGEGVAPIFSDPQSGQKYVSIQTDKYNRKGEGFEDFILLI